MDSNKTLGNLFYAFGAQFVSLILSVCMSFYLPKLLSIDEYSYWQLFIFYTSYAGFFHFGLIDGIYLKLGGKQYDELDFSLLKSEMLIMILTQVIIVIIGIMFLYNSLDRTNIFILITTILFIFIYNLHCFLGYIFQSVNQTKIYSVSIVIDKVFFLLVVLIFFIFRCNTFVPFVLLYLLSKLLSLIYEIYNCRKLFLAPCTSFKKTIKSTFEDLSIGISLMLSNIASMLILGGGRKMIDLVWGITAFGKFSFAMTLTNFFLQFISQISMVLFPALRRMNELEQNTFYKNIRELLGLFLPIIFLVYIPGKWLLAWWLPEYSESLIYMGYLLPICVYDGKMNILCNTYFKVLRKERALLIVNVISMIISIILCSLGAYIFDDMLFIVFGMIISIAFRSIVAEILLSNWMNNKVLKKIFLETLLVCIYLFCIMFMNDINVILLYSIVYIIYLFFNREIIFQIKEQYLKIGKA